MYIDWSFLAISKFVSGSAFSELSVIMAIMNSNGDSVTIIILMELNGIIQFEYSIQSL